MVRLLRPATITLLDVMLPQCERALVMAANTLNDATVWWGARRDKTRADQIIVNSYPRSGTTLVQLIVYYLTDDGSRAFGQLADVSPRLEKVLLRGRTLAEAEAAPVFKNHLPCHHTSGGDARYIYVVRHGLDVAWSWYQWHRAYDGYEGSFEEWLDRFVVRGGVFPLSSSWFTHVRGWLTQKQKARVLLVRYEELVQHRADVIRKIAAFCELPRSPVVVNRVLEATQFAAMRRIERQLDPIVRSVTSASVGRFIRRGRLGDSSEHVSPRMLRRYQTAFDKSLQHLGLDEYREMPVPQEP